MNHLRKALALILAALIIVSIIPTVTVAAKETSGRIIVESKYTMPGETVEVNVVIQDNPGILGATIAFEFAPELTLIAATAGDAFSPLVMTKPGSFTSPCNFVWDGQDLNPDDIKDGVILTLTFKVSDNTPPGSVLDVNISYTNGDILDANERPIYLDTVSGQVSVIDYVLGDLNGDKLVNTTDVIMLRRHIAGGYEQNINELAADNNADGIANTLDIIRLRRYIAGGYDIELLPSPGGCNHILSEVEAVAATCTMDGNIAYWHCTICDRYFSDAEGMHLLSADAIIIKAKGHTPVTDEAVPATPSSSGLTEGSHCGVCGTILVEQQVVPPLTVQQYAIQYSIAGNDNYLAGIEIENPNPQYYTSENGLKLQNLSVKGYVFEGWYDGEGANAVQIKEIPKGETGTIKLYAHWSLVSYLVQFDSPLVPMNSVTYTIKTGTPLTSPTMDGYTFVGWTDDNCNLLSSIPVGTTGDITLHANWTSKRNQTRPNDYANETPAIVEDDINGRFMFAYNIGSIENVPLYTIESFPNMVIGLEISRTVSSSKSIADSTSDTVANMVLNATTSSSAWSISNEWSEGMVVSESHSNEVTQEQIDKARQEYSQSGTWSISSDYGGSNELTKTTTTKEGVSAKITGKFSSDHGEETHGEISIGVPLEVLNLGAKLGGGTTDKYGQEISREIENNREKSFTETSTEKSTWNTNRGYTESASCSASAEVSQRLAQTINNTYGKNYSVSNGGSENTTKSTSETSTNQREYASSFAYSTESTEVVSDTYTFKSEAEGYYRLVCAGTLDVYAVVVYNIKESEYSVYTYSVLREEQDGDGNSHVKTNVFMDYSKNTPNFDDYENGVLPFEVPTFVRDYIESALIATNGLIVDIDTGEIVDFDTTAIVDYDTNGAVVVIPEFIRVDNGDGTHAAIKITGIASDVFTGKNITAVALNKYITSIPDNAFKNCSNLKAVYCPSVTSIGMNAFYGCTSLESFTVTDKVTQLGIKAFSGVQELIVNAVTPTVALAGIDSEAARITINLASMTEDLHDVELVVPASTEYFEFQGANKTYQEVSIESDAGTTVINGATFINTSSVPFRFSSSNVTLNRLTAEAAGYVMILTAETTRVGLYGSVNLSSTSSNATLSQNVIFSRSSSNATGKINVSGNFLICGSITGNNYLTVTNGTVIYLSQEEYERMLHSYKLFFDAGEGICDESFREVANGAPVGELPIPTRDYYSFEGWYLLDNTKVTSASAFSSGEDVTLYAHWTLNPVSDWVLASSAPTDAQIVDRKWTYTLTSYTTSSSSSLSGWTRYDASYEWSGWGSWSDWQDGWVGSNDSTQVETRTGYQYYYYVCSNCGAHMHGYGTCYTWAGGCGKSTVYSSSYHSVRCAVPYSSASDFHGTGVYYTDNTGEGRGFAYINSSSQYYVAPITQYRYRTRYQIWTYYYYKTEEKESYSYPSGSDISNIKEWVKYRAK